MVGCIFRLAIVALIVSLTACGRQPERKAIKIEVTVPQNAEAIPKPKEVPRERELPPDKIELRTVDSDDLMTEIALLKGKVVVVYFWATWSVPDVVDFPHLVELHKKYGTKGVVTISVSLDGRTDDATKTRILRFLVKQQASFRNILLNDATWMEKLDIENNPSTAIFGRDGKPVARHELVGLRSFGEVESMVRELLKSQESP